MTTNTATAPAIEIGRRIYYPGDMANPAGAGVIVAVYGTPGRAPEIVGGGVMRVIRSDDAYFDAILFDGRRLTQIHEHRFSGLRPWRLLDKLHGPALVEKAKELAAAKDAADALASVTAAQRFQMDEAARTITAAPLFYWNGMKDAKGAKLQKAWYSMGQKRVSGSREWSPDGTITIYARDYTRFSELVRRCFVVQNDTDIQTDYFDSDSITVLPCHPLYAQVKQAQEAQEAHRMRRSERRTR